ncbi:MAG TPA: DUF86 domain-containing protein [Candidatus Nanoarchaeia archaeon]|nr:DUF86 domain-containing protein [Candidatus Nanoarchaeia archaeon]
MDRILEKIKEIEEFLDQLSNFTPSTLEDYKSDVVKKAACEHYFEKTMQAITDIAFLTIKLKKFRIPQDDNDSFTVLNENKVIDENLTKNLQNAKSMRNILAHEYGKVNDNLVYESITEELEKDAEEFIEEIKKVIK